MTNKKKKSAYGTINGLNQLEDTPTVEFPAYLLNEDKLTILNGSSWNILDWSRKCIWLGVSCLISILVALILDYRSDPSCEKMPIEPLVWQAVICFVLSPVLWLLSLARCLRSDRQKLIDNLKEYFVMVNEKKTTSLKDIGGGTSLNN